MEMLNRMGLARLVNPCFKIAALEISGCLVVRSSETTKKYRATNFWWNQETGCPKKKTTDNAAKSRK